MSATLIKRRLLVHEAERWVGIREVGGDNRGQAVEMFQKAVDGKAQGEAWCLAFVQFCIQQTDRVYGVFMDMSMPRTILPPTEHCLTLWRTAPKEARLPAPVPGCVVLWGFYPQGISSDKGHAGIVSAVSGDGSLCTIEGNTGEGKGIVREGDGVYTRKRSRMGSPDMLVLGFLSPWI